MKRRGTFSVRIYEDSIIAVAIGEFGENFHGAVRLNETGLVLWNALRDEQTVESLTELIVSEYDVDKETATHDVNIFLDSLKSAGLLEE